MNPSPAETLRKLMEQLQAEQKDKPSRERAVLLTELEKCLAWAAYHDL